MFGLVTASLSELTPEQQQRYRSIYCGICRAMGKEGSQLSRLGLRYDMAFLAALLMSLYEPEEQTGSGTCLPHPVHKRPWTDNSVIRYAARMNIALACYKAKDDWQDDRSLSAGIQAGIFGRSYDAIRQSCPRQCQAIEACIRELNRLEQSGCENPDLPANCFGDLMAELLTMEDDLWAPALRRMGHALGRYIYLADAAIDYDKDRRRGSYNPFLAMGMPQDFKAWEDFLVLEMAVCTDAYERLPLVQDKALLDNILYSGIWINYRKRQKESQEEQHE